MFTSLLGNSDLCQWAPWALAQYLMGSWLCSCPVPATFFFLGPPAWWEPSCTCWLQDSGWEKIKGSASWNVLFKHLSALLKGKRASMLWEQPLLVCHNVCDEHISPQGSFKEKQNLLVRVQSATAKHLSCKSQVYQFLKHHPVWKQCWRKLSEGLWRQDFPAGLTLADECCCGLSFPCTGNGLGTARMGWAALCWTSSPFPATLIHMLSIPSLCTLMNQDQNRAVFPHPPALLHVPGMRISFLKTHTFV